MDKDLRIPAARAILLVDAIKRYLVGDPFDDAGWAQMEQDLDTILAEMRAVLEDNDLL